MRKGGWCIILIVLSCLSGGLSAQGQKYKPADGPENGVEARSKELLSKMTLTEKIDYISGFNGFYIRGIKRLGLPEIKLTDGPVGTHKDGRAVAYPASILSAATWDSSLVYRLGKQLARDSKARGVHILLGPAINIIRSPLGGRNFEYFTEDPFLNAKMAVAYVKGLQDNGVVATVKHFAANNQEWDRNNISSDMDARTLHEIYLPGFKAAVQQGKAGAVMDGYNLVNGVHATQNGALNNQTLKEKWGFDGFVMSDWSATYDAVAAAQGGLDLEMPSGKFFNAKNLLPAIESGRISAELIDDKVLRILRVIIKFGFLDHPQLDRSIALNNPEGDSVALDLARSGIVLLKNEQDILPLDSAKVKTIAVIGPNANHYIAGGGSSYTFPFESVSVLQGLQNYAGPAKVMYAAGVPTLNETVANSRFYTGMDLKVRGLKAQYYNNSRLSGKPLAERTDSIVQIENGWHIAAEQKGSPFDHCSMRWSGFIQPEKSANYRFVVKGFDGFRLKLDSSFIINEWRTQGITTKEVVMHLEAGKKYPVMLEYFASVHPVDISFGWREDKLLFNQAIDIARKADVAIVNVGFNESMERESNDRPFELPMYQDSLIESIRKVNPKTIVLLNAGGNVDMRRWIDQVPGLLHIWYPGQEGGRAIAEILFGKINPSGKLPVSFERSWEDNPARPYYYSKEGEQRVLYKEGLFMGYRYYDTSKVKPLFPFGFGLSYTNFKYRDLQVKRAGSMREPRFTVSFSLENTGNYDGAEVAQLYIRPLHPRVIRPVKELKGFSKVFVKKGNNRRVKMSLDPSSFSYYKTAMQGFGYDPGEYEILIGTSSTDIRLRKIIKLK